MADYQMLTGGSLLGAGNLLRSGNLLGGGSLLMGGAVVPLIRAGWLSPLVTFSRASAAVALGTDGATWAEFVANVPRFHGSARRLLMEGARTNIVRNPRAEGASAPSTPPTNWTMTSQVVSLTTAGTVTVTPGVGYADFNIAFTGTGSVEIRAEPTAQSAGQILAGEQWSLGSIVSLASGTLGGITSVRHMLEFRNSSGVQLSGVETVFVPTATPAAYFTTGLAPTNTDRASMVLRVDGTNGAALTLRVRYPQVERGASTSTPVLPPVGSPAASTRAQDIATVTSLASLGFSAAGGTVIFDGIMPAGLLGTADRAPLLNLRQGAMLSLLAVQMTGAGSVRVASRDGATNTEATLSASDLRGQRARIVAVFDAAAGQVRGSVNGGAVVTGTLASATPTELRIGRSATVGTIADTAAFAGEIGELTYLPYPLPAAVLPANSAL